jgi:RsiW-degrading membrane proteinase PrsW (M82 family)
MIKPRGFDLHVPKITDEKLEISSPVTGASFIRHLNDARRAFEDDNHNVRFIVWLFMALLVYASLNVETTCSSLLLEFLQMVPI